MDADPRRKLPSVDSLINALGARGRADRVGGRRCAERASTERAGRLGAKSVVPTESEFVEQVRSELEHLARPSLRRVINASGVILQTNLGRAPLSKPALAAMAEVAAASNLEYDLEEGARGSRHEHVRSAHSTDDRRRRRDRGEQQRRRPLHGFTDVLPGARSHRLTRAGRGNWRRLPHPGCPSPEWGAAVGMRLAPNPPIPR